MVPMYLAEHLLGEHDTSGQVAALLPSPGWIFAAWGFGALISLAGALTNAELGAMYPRAGGDYVFLREAFHPLAGFLVGWLTFFAIYAGSIAALAAAFGAGLSEALGWEGRGSLAIAVGVTVLVSGANYVGVRWGARANNLTSVLKIAALATMDHRGPNRGINPPKMKPLKKISSVMGVHAAKAKKVINAANPGKAISSSISGGINRPASNQVTRAV